MAGQKLYIVHPDDDDIEPRQFRNLYDAKTWAATFCSNYWIEEAET